MKKNDDDFLLINSFKMSEVRDQLDNLLDRIPRVEDVKKIKVILSDLDPEGWYEFGIAMDALNIEDKEFSSFYETEINNNEFSKFDGFDMKEKCIEMAYHKYLFKQNNYRNKEINLAEKENFYDSVKLYLDSTTIISIIEMQFPLIDKKILRNLNVFVENSDIKSYVDVKKKNIDFKQEIKIKNLAKSKL